MGQAVDGLSGEDALRQARIFLGPLPPKGIKREEQARTLIDLVLGAIEDGQLRPCVFSDYRPPGDPEARERGRDWVAVQALVAADSVVQEGKAIPFLQNLILDAYEPRTRMEAILEVIPLGNQPAIVQALVGALRDGKTAGIQVPNFTEQPTVGEVAACALVEIGDANGLREMVRLAVFWDKRLGEFLPFYTRDELIKAADEVALDALIEVLRGDLPDQPWLHERPAHIIEKVEGDARSVAASLLAEMAGKDAAGVLTSALDPQKPIRGIIKALGTLGAPHAIARIAGVMERGGPEEFSCRNSIEAIVKEAKNLTSDDRADIGKQLIGMVESESVKVRALGVEQLGKLGYMPATEALDKALSDPESKVRKAAKKAAKQIAHQ